MPTFITHAFIGGAAAKALEDRKVPVRVWLLAVVLSILPDADVIGFRLGIQYGDFLGHRGFFHSPFFSIMLSILCVLVFFRKCRPFSRSWWKYVVFFSAVGASHGLLDALTDGGLGVALLAPFNNARYFFRWTPIPVSPIGIEPFLSGWGLRVFILEVVYMWIPAAVTLIVFLFVKRHILAGAKAFGRA